MRSRLPRWLPLLGALALLLCLLPAGRYLLAHASGSCQFLSNPQVAAAFCDTFAAPGGTGNRSGALDGAVWGVSRISSSNNFGQGENDGWNSARAAATPPGQLVFDDEFTGTSLDTSLWAPLNRPGDASNSEQECYLPSNVTQSGGALTLTDRADTSCAGFSYTSGMVVAKSFTFTYGTLEVRAQMPSGTGQWPALWLLGANCQASYPADPGNVGTCRWPVPGSDEVDLFETINTQATAGWFSLHTGPAPDQDSFFNSCSGVGLGVNTHTGTHTYDLTWAPGSLVWQVDGTTVCTMSQHVPTTPMFPLLNIAVGGSFPGQAVDRSVLPQSMQVDYLRVYQQAAGTPTATPIPATATNTATPGSATATGTATRTPTPGAGGILGSAATTGGQFDTGGDANGLDGIRVVTGAGGGAVSALSAYVGATDGAAFGMAIYTEVGGHPGALVAGAGGVLGPPGWQTVPVAATLAPNTAYWLVYNEAVKSGGGGQLYTVPGPQSAAGWSASPACCAFPATAPSWIFSPTIYALYATLGGAPASSTPTGTPTVTRTATPTQTATVTPTGTPTASSTPTSTQTPVPPDTATATATASDTAIPSSTPTPGGVLGPYGCLYPGVAYIFNSTLSNPAGAVVWTSPPTPYTVDPGSGPACTPGG